MVTRRRRVAVCGGDGRLPGRVLRSFGAADELVVFPSPGDAGNAGPRRLAAAIGAGAIDEVVILARWNAHSVTRQVRRLCSARGVPVRIVP